MDMPSLHPSYPIETNRLSLRPFQKDDLADLFAIFSRQDVTRYLYWPVLGRDETRDLLSRWIAQVGLDEEGDAISLAVCRQDSGQLIGEAMLRWLSEVHSQGEIGFMLHPDHHGQGFATEAARALLELGFDRFGLHRIIGRLEARNRPSAAVLERLGMRLEAHLRENEWVKGEWNDEQVYAILHAEWDAIDKD
jgi:RimJ/RimL family protein N-acetyltransferase